MVLALGPAAIVAAPPAQAYTPSSATVAAYEARVAYRINVIRASYGRGRLNSAQCPDYYAERWAPYLARTWSFYHQSMYTILRGCGARVAAENLARGNVSADAIVAAGPRARTMTSTPSKRRTRALDANLMPQTSR